MAISKIILNGVTQMDVTQDTVVEATLKSGETAHRADGVQITGTMSGGGSIDYESGTFTTPSSGNTYELTFSNTYSSYMILIEMTSNSKTALMNSGRTAGRTFSMIGVYPQRSVNNTNNPYQSLLLRVNPSNSNMDYGGPTTTFVYTSSSLTMPLGPTTSANQLYREFTYNYFVVEIK